MPLQVAYTNLEFVFDPQPLILDRRGQLAGLSRGYPFFVSTNIAPDHVLFDAPQRWLRLDVQRLNVMAAGSDDLGPLIEFVFMLLTVASVPQTMASRLTRFYALPSTKSVPQLVAEHSGFIAGFADPRPVAQLVDVGTIFSIDYEGRMLNYQYGPMGRSQWQAIGGAKLAPVEAKLPAVAWGIGVYDREPKAATVDLKGTKRMVVDTFSKWETLVQQSVSKGA